MNRKLYGLFIFLFLIFLNFGSIFAQDNIFYIEDYFVNPIYADIVNEEELQSRYDYRQLLLSTESVDPVTSIEDLTNNVKSDLKKFSPYIRQTLYTDSFYSTANFLTNVYNNAMIHSGFPNEGDYLKWNYSYVNYCFERSYAPADSGYKYQYNI